MCLDSSSTELSDSPGFASRASPSYLTYMVVRCMFTCVLHCTWSRQSTGDRTQETNYKLPDYLTYGCTCTIGADQDPRKPEPRTNTALHQNQYGRPQCGPRCQIFRTHGGRFPIRWAWLLVVLVHTEITVLTLKRYDKHMRMM